MRVRWSLILALSLFVAACDDDEENGTTDTGGDTTGDVTGDTTADTTGDAAPDTTGDAPVDQGADEGTGDPLVERGEYLVEHILACADCHTPRNQDGSFNREMWLAGQLFADIDPVNEGTGAVYAANLTPHETGLGDWTDEEVLTALTTGIYAAKGRHSEEGPLFPAMPYFLFHLMTDEDLDSIVAYLRSIDPVDNEIPEREPLPFPFTEPAGLVPEEDIPRTTLAENDPDYEAAEAGRYLAQLVCVDCHTVEDPDGPAAIDVDQLFIGGRIFPAAAFGLPVPPFPADIYTRNLTPHETGIQGWTPEQIETVLRGGTDLNGDGVCPPMPVGPQGPFGGMTEEDALNIGIYLTTLPAVESDNWPQCEVTE